MFKSIYYYIDKFNRDEIHKLNKTINIIYRNYSSRFIKKEILQLVTFCKKQRRKVYISNNLKLALRFNFDGVGPFSSTERLQIYITMEIE